MQLRIFTSAFLTSLTSRRSFRTSWARLWAGAGKPISRLDRGQRELEFGRKAVAAAPVRPIRRGRAGVVMPDGGDLGTAWALAGSLTPGRHSAANGGCCAEAKVLHSLCYAGAKRIKAAGRGLDAGSRCSDFWRPGETRAVA
jgi:hypothetical protein